MTQPDALITQNLGIAHTLVHRVTRLKPTHQDYDDAFQVALLAMAESARTWSPDGGASFATYAWRNIELKLWRWWFRERRHYVTQTTRLNARRSDQSPEQYGADDGPGAKTVIDRIGFERGVSSNPEELLIAAEERAIGARRLERLGERDRQTVEKVLDGEPARLRPWHVTPVVRNKKWGTKHLVEVESTVSRIARAAGVRAPGTEKGRAPLAGSERFKRYLGRMTDEMRVSYRERQNAYQRAYLARKRAKAREEARA